MCIAAVLRVAAIDAKFELMSSCQSPSRAKICDGICSACGAAGGILAYRRAAGEPSRAQCGLSFVGDTEIANPRRMGSTPENVSPNPTGFLRIGKAESVFRAGAH